MRLAEAPPESWRKVALAPIGRWGPVLDPHPHTHLPFTGARGTEDTGALSRPQCRLRCCPRLRYCAQRPHRGWGWERRPGAT